MSKQSSNMQEESQSSSYLNYLHQFISSKYTYQYALRFLFIGAFAATDVPLLAGVTLGVATGHYVQHTLKLLPEWQHFYRETQALKDLSGERKQKRLMKCRKTLTNLIAKTALLISFTGVFIAGLSDKNSDAGYMIEAVSKKFATGIGVHLIDKILAAIAAGSFTYYGFTDLLGPAFAIARDQIFRFFENSSNHGHSDIESQEIKENVDTTNETNSEKSKNGLSSSDVNLFPRHKKNGKKDSGGVSPAVKSSTSKRTKKRNYRSSSPSVLSRSKEKPLLETEVLGNS